MPNFSFSLRSCWNRKVVGTSHLCTAIMNSKVPGSRIPVRSISALPGKRALDNKDQKPSGDLKRRRMDSLSARVRPCQKSHMQENLTAKPSTVHSKPRAAISRPCQKPKTVRPSPKRYAKPMDLKSTMKVMENNLTAMTKRIQVLEEKMEEVVKENVQLNGLLRQVHEHLEEKMIEIDILRERNKKMRQEVRDKEHNFFMRVLDFSPKRDYSQLLSMKGSGDHVHL